MRAKAQGLPNAEAAQFDRHRRSRDPEWMLHDLAVAFAALSPRARIAVLARTIHMETIHARAAHLEHPDDPAPLYRSSEFVHRLSGSIMGLARDREMPEAEMRYAAASLIEGVAPHGQAYLDKLGEWIAEAGSIS